MRKVEFRSRRRIFCTIHSTIRPAWGVKLANLLGLALMKSGEHQELGGKASPVSHKGISKK
jgi:hypothetical protein